MGSVWNLDLFWLWTYFNDFFYYLTIPWPHFYQNFYISLSHIALICIVSTQLWFHPRNQLKYIIKCHIDPMIYIWSQNFFDVPCKGGLTSSWVDWYGTNISHRLAQDQIRPQIIENVIQFCTPCCVIKFTSTQFQTPW